MLVVSHFKMSGHTGCEVNGEHLFSSVDALCQKRNFQKSNHMFRMKISVPFTILQRLLKYQVLYPKQMAEFSSENLNRTLSLIKSKLFGIFLENTLT